MEKPFHMAAVLLSLITFAQATIENSDIALILNTLNSLRSNVDPPASNMQEMVWNEELSTAAQLFSEYCLLEYDPDRNSVLIFNTVGETWSAISVSVPNYRQIISVAWIRQRSQYKFENNTCSSPDICSPYTQLVWAETMAVGCGSTEQCPDIPGFPQEYSTIFICYYGPAGNTPGQHPYLVGTSCSKCNADQVCINNLCGLPAARDLMYRQNENNFTISWTVPPLLNILSFCVNVTTSSTAPVSLVSQCDIIQSPFSYQLLNHSVRCIPINIVLMAIDHVGIRREASLLYDSCSRSCQAPCDDPPLLVDGYIYSNNRSEKNSVVNFGCDLGYYLSPPVSFSICNNSGSWVPEPAFTKCLPIPKCNPDVNLTMESTSNFKFIAAIEIALLVLVGLILFVTGIVTVSVAVLLIVKKYVRGKHFKIISSTGSSRKDRKAKLNMRVDNGFRSTTLRTLDEKTKLDLHMDSGVQRDEVSKPNEKLQGRDIIHVTEAGIPDHGGAIDEDNIGDAKYPTTTKSSSTNIVKYEITKTDSRSDSKSEKYKGSGHHTDSMKNIDDNYFEDKKSHITNTDSSSYSKYDKPVKGMFSDDAKYRDSPGDPTDSSSDTDTDNYWRSKKRSQHQEGILMLSVGDPGGTNLNKYANLYLPSKKGSFKPITVLPKMTKAKTKDF